ncbi:MAG: FKBP-type peptidyl-prolyl cis-trans isomerase [Pseudomonadota bacterium]|nr:FKBP-type peptidyl-prolyl cis-trans isomerase [Pseudomonadota bacterium]
MNEVVRDGSEILLEYRILLSDGRAVEEGVGEETFQLRVGAGAFPQTVESALHGMGEGESQIVAVSADENAFGEIDSEKVLTLARSEFSDEMDPEAGSLVGFMLPSGEEIAGRVVHVVGEQVEVDFNHPLIGHDVLFEVEVIQILKIGGP